MNEFLNVEEAAQYLDLAPAYLYNLVHKRKIKYYKPGQKLYFRVDDLREYLLSGEIKPQHEIEQEACKLMLKSI